MCISNCVIASEMGKPSKYKVIFTCEHAANDVPGRFMYLFDGADHVLKSHRGWDPGALELAEILSEKLASPLFVYPFTRLLIEPNRSAGHPGLFSEFSRNLSGREKIKLINSYYLPYRNRVEQEIGAVVKKGCQVIHVGVHTFTPDLMGVSRDFDIGLLYDPKHSSEKEFCRDWKKQIKMRLPDLRLRMNQPYKGASDGFTTALRKKFGETHYLGIELEVSQKLSLDENFIQQKGEVIAGSLSDIAGVG